MCSGSKASNMSGSENSTVLFVRFQIPYPYNFYLHNFFKTCKIQILTIGAEQSFAKTVIGQIHLFHEK